MDNADKMKKQLDLFSNGLDKLIDDIAKSTLSFYKKSFDNQGFTDETLETWVKRRREYTWPILRKTGALKNSIQQERIGRLSFKIFTTMEYAPYHNNGTPTLPQRQFIGESKQLTKDIYKEIDKFIKKIFK